MYILTYHLYAENLYITTPNNSFIIFPPPPMAQHPLVDNGLLSIRASLSHENTTHSVGHLWTSDQSDAEIST
jgi:hypothetical protein